MAKLKRRKPSPIVTAGGETIAVPSVDELLSISPLPPELAGMESIIRHHPQMQDLVALAVACIAHGLPAETAIEAMRVAVDAFDTTEHRCVTCLNWTDNPRLCGFFAGGQFTMLAFCRRCESMIDEGRATREMQRNLRAYAGGGR